MKTPERIWRFKPYRGTAVHSVEKLFSESTEYVKASLLKSWLKDDKWLADNGLKRIADPAKIDVSGF